MAVSLTKAAAGFLWKLSAVLAMYVGCGISAIHAQAFNRLGPGGMPKVHYFQDAQQAPGSVAAAQILRQIPGAGTFQAVSISGPEKLKIGLAQAGTFLAPIDAPVITGMLVGAVYRFRVTGIPFRPGQELYPSVEVIDRIFAPAGREHRFPIPIVLTQEDLQLALDGALVTRVIYLEDSEIAEPIAALPGSQRTVDVDPADNALKTADQLGRPVAILRIGSRVPADLTGDLSHFLYGCPPWIPLPTAPSREQLITSGAWPEIEISPAVEPMRSEAPGENYPRIPLGK
jgi:hypothetical protein